VVLTALHLCAGNLYGGIERIVAECAAGRDLTPSLRHRVVTCFDGRLAAELDASGAPCPRLGEVRVSRPLSVMRARRRLADLLTTNRPQAAICHSPWTFGLAAPVLRRLGVPSVIWVHDRLSGRTWSERWAALTRPDAAIANSHFTSESVGFVFPRLTPSVLYAPVPASPPLSAAARAALRTSLGVEDDRTCVVLLASRLERWKGHRELITAIAGVPGGWRMWIAGGAQKPGELEYEQELRSLCVVNGIANRVRFLGDRRDVGALMRAADVHCQPNNAPEPFGLAFVEALYASLPVVTTAMGGALEILTTDCGVLVPPGDIEALRVALQRLIGEPDTRRTLGRGGPARAAELCQPERQLRTLASIVERVAA
jgi:glycosyltransferase involved in cell wall biosynthesis